MQKPQNRIIARFFLCGKFGRKTLNKMLGFFVLLW